jgi:DNA helicase-2/ATP-dependent DNA helicase PcrA
VDGQQQTPRIDKEEGFVRLFILPNNTANKMEKERIASQRMAAITGDALWAGENAKVKTLILEHHMAARRMGFLDMYEPLHKNERLKIGLLDGSLSGLRLFGELALPVVKSKQDPFAVASVVRKHSPLLSRDSILAAGSDQTTQLKAARAAVGKLWDLCADGKTPRFLDVLLCLHSTKLFALPDNLRIIAARSQPEQETAEREIEIAASDDASVFDAWDKFLITPFQQIEQYTEYMDDEADFDTHQGVKGLEFPRVMVIIDDTEARGFSFSYEKLFGAKDKTKADLDCEKEGKETGIDKTRRLFYVTCSRAEKSLAIVAYSENPQQIKQFVVAQGWFSNDEVEAL